MVADAVRSVASSGYSELEMSRKVSWPIRSVICSGPNTGTKARSVVWTIESSSRGSAAPVSTRWSISRSIANHTRFHRKPGISLCTRIARRPTSSQKPIVVVTTASLVFSPATTSTKMISCVCTGWRTRARSGWAIPAASRVIGKLDVALHRGTSGPITASMSR